LKLCYPNTRYPNTIPQYNLEWPRVTPIQDTLIIGPPAKASHHEHHLKLCKNSPRAPTLHQNRLAASRVARRNLVPDRLAGISHRQALSASQKSCCSITAWQTPPCRQAPCIDSGHYHYFGILSPRGSPRAARRHTSSAMILVFCIFLRS